MKRLEDMGNMEIDVLREIGSIGTGNAATALSGLLSRKVEMTLPRVEIQGYNEAIASMGGPETIVSGVLVKLSGEINGLMLYIQRLDFINLVLGQVLSEQITGYDQLREIEISALVEIGNIMISSYVSAIAKLTGISVNLSVPAISVNMLGGILSVPMIEYGHQSDKIMTIDGKFICDSKEVYSNLLLVPEVRSLNYLMKKLGVTNE